MHTSTAIYGIALLACATLIALLYEDNLTAVVVFLAVVQTLALLLLVPLLRDYAAEGSATP